MKRTTLLALAAMLVLLAGCKHEDEVTPPAEDLITKNQIVKFVKYSETLFGLDTATINSKLYEDGWADAGESDGYIMFTKTKGGIAYELGYVCKYSVATKIMGITYYLSSAKPVLTEAQAFKGTMQYIGENFTIKSYTCPFLSMKYEENGKQVEINNYSEALEKVQSIDETDDLAAKWDASPHGFTLQRTYSAPSKKVYNLFLIR